MSDDNMTQRQISALFEKFDGMIKLHNETMQAVAGQAVKIANIEKQHDSLTNKLWGLALLVGGALVKVFFGSKGGQS